MPCSGNINTGPLNLCNHSSSVEIEKELRERINKFDKENYKLKAICCALINEVDNETIERAEKKGKVDIKSFAEEHKREDEKRLRNALLHFSTHELQMIKKMLRVEDGS